MSDPEVFDQEMTLSRFDGDEVLLRLIVACFLEDAPRQVERLRELLAEGEWTQAQRAAHAFRGAAANVGAAGVLSSALSLEEAARDRRAAEAGAIFDGLKDDVARFRDAVERSGLVPNPGFAAEGDRR